MASTALAVTERDLECPICQETFKPRILPCGHTVCAEPLKENNRKCAMHIGCNKTLYSIFGYLLVISSRMLHCNLDVDITV